jgi:hypothetical protein
LGSQQETAGGKQIYNQAAKWKADCQPADLPRTAKKTQASACAVVKNNQ